MMPGTYVALRPGGQVSLPPDAHLTLAYLGRRAGVQEVVYALERMPSWHAFLPLKLDVQGYGTWAVAPQHYVLWASVGGARWPKLYGLHSAVLQDLHAAGLATASGPGGGYPFVPHITLDKSSVPFTGVPYLHAPRKFSVSRLFVSRGGEHVSLGAGPAAGEEG